MIPNFYTYLLVTLAEYVNQTEGVYPMKKLDQDFLFSLFIKCMWLLFVVIIILEIAFTINTSKLFIENTAKDISYSWVNELEYQLDVTWVLADALSDDLIVSDTSIPLADRALYLKNFQEKYGLFLIGVTDKEGNMASTFNDELSSISYREYFNYTMNMGQTIITDPMSTHLQPNMFNYVINSPYYAPDNNQIPLGSIVMAVPLDGLKNVITQSSPSDYYTFTLLDSNNTVMLSSLEDRINMPFHTLLESHPYTSKSTENIMYSIGTKSTSSYWAIENHSLLYVTHSPVEHTSWTMLTRMNVPLFIKDLLILSLVKISLVSLLFIMAFVLSKRYIRNKLKDINSMLYQMSRLQENLREEKLLSTNTFEELVHLSTSGLIDSLSGLPTRLRIKMMIESILSDPTNTKQGMFAIIDLDDLKYLNDTFGHPVGDKAIIHFGEILKQWSSDWDCIVGRFGGDEFLAFYQGEDFESIAEQMRSSLCIDLIEKDVKIPVHASIGISIYPTNSDHFDQLYILADEALYLSKRAGKNCFTFSHPKT